ncbi:hypothetical protein KY349_03135 [Candidatus Woesearchaeota archaeon]|nr:hypothetical protein [Candidatus Woesearchaeota archaeon]
MFAPQILAQEAPQDTGQDSYLSKYNIQMYIEQDKVLVESYLLFASEQSTNFSVELPYDASSITNEVDGFEYPAILEFNKLMFYLRGNRLVTYDYLTRELLEKDTFVASINAPFDTEKMTIRLSLPEGAILEKPMRKGAVQGSSIFPKPKTLDTDGRAISVIWQFEDLKKGDEVALYLKYKRPSNYKTPLTIVIIAALVIIVSSAYITRKSRKHSRTQESKAEKPAEQRVIESHLKEDEEQIINILKLKEGSCEQGTLRIATGFSKAKLSGLLKELQERKVIHKEKRGKKNLVFLK